LGRLGKILGPFAYKRSQYLLSRKAIDNARMIIDGYIALVLIHQDDLRDPFPCLPWSFHEACETRIWEAGKGEGFTMLDPYYNMIPK